MKQLMKEKIMRRFSGRVLIPLVSAIIGLTVAVILRAEVSEISTGIVERLKEFRSLIAIFTGVLSVQVFFLVYEKIQSSKQKDRVEAEIRKLELENERLKLENERLQLRNENQQIDIEE